MSFELLAKSFHELQNLYNYTYFRPVQTQQVTPIVEPDDTSYIESTFVTPEQIWKDAIAVLESNQFYSVSVVGPQGSGKTELARILSKYAYKNGFKLVYALPDDFLPDVDSWIKKIIQKPRAKNCLVIDDLSYTLDMQPRKTQALVKNLVARFRHVFGGQLLVIYITHRLHAAPPILRNSGTWIFSAMQSADRDDAKEIIGRSKDMKDRLESLYTFIAKVSVEGAKNKTVKFVLDDVERSFRWGTKDDKGDGRLMACYHSGKLSVFCSKVFDEPIDFEEFRFKRDDSTTFFDSGRKNN